jgi:hypothetical protein
MVADADALRQAGKKGEVVAHGGATWYRQADWFNGRNGYRSAGNILLPFSTTTIERGLRSMKQRGYIATVRKKRAPDGKRLQRARNIYTNKFDQVGTAEVIDISTWAANQSA